MTPVVPLKACWLNHTEMSCYLSHLSAETDRGEFDESLIPGFPPLLGVGTVDICETLIPGFPPLLGVGTVDICETLIPGFPPLLGVGTVDICETLIPGFPPLLGVGTVDICCEQPTGKGRNVQRLPVPRPHPKQGCQTQIQSQTDRGRILQVRGFHCLLPKDRIIWDSQYIVHVYYIHIRTVVKEVNKGIRCVNL